MAARQLPLKFRQVLVKGFGTDFRKVTEIAERTMLKAGPGEILVRNRYLGINASDINFTAGRYGKQPLPFPCGFEGLGDVVQVGSESSVKVGQPVVYISNSAFAEYVVLKANEAIPVPSPDPAFISLLVSGLTASISLEKEADLQPGKTVLVTAAAGGTGQYAVQLAKLAGCHVLGTCSNNDKAQFLKSIGCDRPINYKEEKLNEVLSKEYPTGIDVVYESIGKDVFDVALKNLAQHGRLIVIGMISGYQSDGKIANKTKADIPLAVLTKSASLRGFLLFHHARDYARHIGLLIKMYTEGTLKIAIDNGSEKPFIGLEGIPKAIDHMYSGKNVGKIVVALPDPPKSML